MNIGSRIKELRLKNNLTLEELGKKTKISRQNLHKYEQGIISNKHNRTKTDKNNRRNTRTRTKIRKDRNEGRRAGKAK